VIEVLSAEDALGFKVEHEHLKTYEMLERYVEIHKKLPPKDDFYRSIVADHHREDPQYYHNNPNI
jgi:hypothetical protein